MSRYSQIPNNTIFQAGGTNYRKVDALYYEDLTSGFQSVWNPMFDTTIAVKTTQPVSTTDVNTTDKFVVDSQNRIMKPNPDYQENPPSRAEKALGEMWGSGEFDCGPDDYEWMAKTAISAMRLMKEIPPLTTMLLTGESKRKINAQK